MKLLYLTFQEDAPLYLGVTRKIAAQARAFESLGFTVTYTLWKGPDYIFQTGENTEPFPVPEGGGRMRRFAAAARAYLDTHRFDVLYFRLDRVSFDAVNLCRLARARGAKRVILEIPNYPYLKDYIRNGKSLRPFSRKLIGTAKILGVAAEDRLSGLSLKNVVDAAVLIGNKSEHFFSVKAINITNGVDVDSYRLDRHDGNAGEITMIGVAGTLWWQAYDRVLAGMGEYKKKHKTPRFRFLLVGGDAKEMPEFHAQAKRYGVEGDVECPGFLTGDALSAAYARADVGVSSLGCYRRGLTRCSSLKAREYCAAGLPFLYAYEDDVLRGTEPFVMKLPNDPTPVDMEQVAAFLTRFRADPSARDQECAFARSRYDWKSILKQVLDFAGAKTQE